MDNALIRKLPVPVGSDLDPTEDTQPVVQNEGTINFFPPAADRSVFRANYIKNPLPGNSAHRIAGVTFDLVSQFIWDDPANGIDVVNIVNGLKYAGVILTADESHTQFLRTTIEECSNFSGTQIETQTASAYVDGAVTSQTRKTAKMASSSLYRLDDPFDLAPQQNINLSLTFGDPSVFPTAAQWEASSQNQLRIKATLYLAELPSMQTAV